MSRSSTMERPLICTSLRTHPDWGSLPPLILHGNSPCGKWRETPLDTHDVAIPLSPQRVFRANFISPRDVASPECLNRVERLYNLNGASDSGIIFLLKHDNDHPSAMASLMTLQLRLVGNWELPIVPVSSVAAASATLATLRRQLVCPPINQCLPGSASGILAFCSDRVSLAEHTVNVLTDITSNFRDLLGKLSSDATFELEISQLLDEDAIRLRGFWTDDHLVD